MSRFAISIAASALSLTAHGTTPAYARAIEDKNLVNGKETIDPARGYIYLASAGRYAGTFIRVPDDEDVTTFRADRAEALVKAKERYVKDHAAWKRKVETAAKLGKKVPDEPIEPTEESFSFGAIETITATTFGPQYAFAKGADSYSYLEEVKPGRYIWYGPILFDPSQGHVGLCYCMGSVTFEVRAGEITNLGNYLTSAPKYEDQPTAPLMEIMHSGGLNGFRVKLPERSSAVNYTLPQSLAAHKSSQAVFSASGKMNNFYGVMVGRLPPIDGVLAYDRDTVIDLRSGQTLDAPKIPR